MDKQEVMKVRDQATKDMNLIKNNPVHLIKKFQLLSEQDKHEILFMLNMNLMIDDYMYRLKHGNLILLQDRRG